MTTVIEAEGLTRRFGATQALAGVDISAGRGQVLALLGPNGAGKTTIMRILATLLKPDSGSARVGGYDVLSQAVEVRQLIALTGQYASLDEELTGTENLIMICRLLGNTRPAARARAGEMLERFDLAAAAGRALKTYSGGIRVRRPGLHHNRCRGQAIFSHLVLASRFLEKALAGAHTGPGAIARG